MFRALLLLTPDVYLQFGKIVNVIEESNLTISNFKIAKLSKQDAEKLCENQKGKSHYNDLVNFLSSDLVLGVEVLAENCISKVKEVGSAIRSKFASDQVKSAVLFS